ncbi:NAD(P)-binding protein [Rhizopus microsporus var. microsporus]|uniref:4-dihydrotrisporin dehydrogenase n=2 Tax=Rhizopus microsporus TaxID=58291 RepID=A0A2G4SQI0_RHIZD|nr:4-dihydrotrisporin dehydrogenase [Rhizopus microsporus ATCC 52813]ORE06815.1 NAD(P)-binding protein [Rhizopus microsporus var. microsporus]PHZ10646.1 4-dihydrotrisporin dehydrogenase [Rhizopus microsporus ATCC 52813]
MSTYVITGASRGLGLEFVKQLSAKDNTVFACARNPDQAEELKKLVDNKKVYSIKLDTTNEQSLKGAVDEISKHAPNGIDVLINNAGIALSRKTIEETGKDELMKTFETNVAGVVETTNAFLPLLRKRGKDHTKKIVNISSLLGSVGLCDSKLAAAYRVSKSAVNMVTKLQSLQFAEENFIVYSAHPGWVQTDMGGADAHITPDVSIKGMLSKLESATSKDNGGFFSYTGESMEW